MYTPKQNFTDAINWLASLSLFSTSWFSHFYLSAYIKNKGKNII